MYLQERWKTLGRKAAGVKNPHWSVAALWFADSCKKLRPPTDVPQNTVIFPGILTRKSQITPNFFSKNTTRENKSQRKWRPNTSRKTSAQTGKWSRSRRFKFQIHSIQGHRTPWKWTERESDNPEAKPIWEGESQSWLQRPGLGHTQGCERDQKKIKLNSFGFSLLRFSISGGIHFVQSSGDTTIAQRRKANFLPANAWFPFTGRQSVETRCYSRIQCTPTSCNSCPRSPPKNNCFGVKASTVPQNFLIGVATFPNIAFLSRHSLQNFDFEDGFERPIQVWTFVMTHRL